MSDPVLPLALLLLLPAFADDDVEIEVEGAYPPVDPPVAPSSAPIPPAPPPVTPSPAAVPPAAAAVPPAAADAPAAALPAPAAEPPSVASPSTLGLRIRGYAQPQVVFSQLSEDEVNVDGATLNLDRFLLRRARIIAVRDARSTQVVLGVDLNTVAGPQVSPSDATVRLHLPSSSPTAPPYVALTAGLFDIPFGNELPEDSDERWFMERSLGSRALFPGDNDLGAQLSGGFGPARYQVAVVNGVPLSYRDDDEGVVYNARKTVVGRIGGVGETERVQLGGGLSYLTGQGLHVGTPETKSGLLWSDNNQNGLVTLDELVGVNGQAATASEPFEQWAINADVQLGVRTSLGWTRAFGEATMAENLDRGYLPADPISTGYGLREVAWAAGATQDVGQHVVLGFRADRYDPNSDFFESQRGEFIPTDLSVLTLSPLVGAELPHEVRLVLQYDYIVDFLGRDALAQPVDLANDQWTLRAQGAF